MNYKGGGSTGVCSCIFSDSGNIFIENHTRAIETIPLNHTPQTIPYGFVSVGYKPYPMVLRPGELQDPRHGIA